MAWERKPALRRGQAVAEKIKANNRLAAGGPKRGFKYARLQNYFPGDSASDSSFCWLKEKHPNHRSHVRPGLRSGLAFGAPLRDVGRGCGDLVRRFPSCNGTREGKGAVFAARCAIVRRIRGCIIQNPTVEILVRMCRMYCIHDSVEKRKWVGQSPTPPPKKIGKWMSILQIEKKY